ncbi:MAG: catalase, partial [Terracidiphilus sp.]
FAVTAFEFTNADGETRYGRYRIVPVEGNDYLTDEKVAEIAANYHFDELAERVAKEPVAFKILVQVAEPGDTVDDATAHWPENREVVELGRLELTEVLPDSLAQQKHIIFDPIPRVDGIEASADPLLELRAAIYLLSGRRRRAAE